MQRTVTFKKLLEWNSKQKKKQTQIKEKVQIANIINICFPYRTATYMGPVFPIPKPI